MWRVKLTDAAVTLANIDDRVLARMGVNGHIYSLRHGFILETVALTDLRKVRAAFTLRSAGAFGGKPDRGRAIRVARHATRAIDAAIMRVLRRPDD
jgi:hypothetical protein